VLLGLPLNVVRRARQASEDSKHDFYEVNEPSEVISLEKSFSYAIGSGSFAYKKTHVRIV
jgi:hypothetical protein